MDDLRRRMQQLGERGEARGAARVLAEARRGSAAGTGVRPTRLVTAVAIAACVTLIGGVAAALWAPGDGEESETALTPIGDIPAVIGGTTSTSAQPEVSVPTVELPAQLIAASRLAPFSGCGAFLSYVKGKAAEVVGPYGLPYLSNRMLFLDNAAGGQAGLATGDAGGQRGPGPSPAARVPATEQGTFSATNVQEAGIDEPDLVKTDGRVMYSVVNSMLRTVDVVGAPRLLDSLGVPGATEMLLVGDRAVLFGNGVQGNGRVRSVIAVIDVSRPASLRLLSRMELDGSYLSARLVNGVPRVVVNSGGQPMLAFPAFEGDEASLTARNRQVVAGSSADDWLPTFTMTEGPRKGRSGQLASCASSYRPPQFAGFGMLTVLTLNVADPSASDSTSVVADGDIVYGSANRMYVTTSRWGQFSPASGVAPVSETLVHAFDISAPDRAVYKVSGLVRGTALNQFSLSEDEGYLRIATTDPNGGSESFVSVLADRGQALVQVGQVGGLGKTERIQAVRFIGKMAYVVTFRQTDPLYVVDVSDPTNPRVRGELKILGYSAYLHPIGDNLLIGFGIDATEEGMRQGLAVSLFDVSDPSAPKRLQHRSLGAGYSAAEFDHRAFLWWAPTELTVVPINSYTNEGQPELVGAIGLRIDRAAIAEAGRVQHPARDANGYPYRPFIQRSLVVGDALYTVSEDGVLQSSLATLGDRAFVRF